MHTLIVEQHNLTRAPIYARTVCHYTMTWYKKNTHTYLVCVWKGCGPWEERV